MRVIVANDCQTCELLNDVIRTVSKDITVKRAIRFLGFSVVLFLVGCTNSYKVARLQTATLPAGSTAYIGLPEDGRYETTTYSGSGNKVATAVADTFLPYFSRVEVATSPTSFDQTLAAASSRGMAYALYPTIVHWEDRATEWSGKSDRVTVRLDVVDARSRQVIDTATLEGKSKFMTFGGDVPEDMLKPSLQQYAEKLFGTKANKTKR